MADGWPVGCAGLRGAAAEAIVTGADCTPAGAGAPVRVWNFVYLEIE